MKRFKVNAAFFLYFLYLFFSSNLIQHLFYRRNKFSIFMLYRYMLGETRSTTFRISYYFLFAKCCGCQPKHLQWIIGISRLYLSPLQNLRLNWLSGECYLKHCFSNSVIHSSANAYFRDIHLIYEHSCYDCSDLCLEGKVAPGPLRTLIE